MKYETLYKDIKSYKVDVIVNTWHTNIFSQFRRVTGVSERIKEGAGKVSFRELYAKGRLNLSDIVITQPGDLPVDCIVHVAAVDFFGNTNDQVIIRSIKNVLEFIRAKNYSSAVSGVIGANRGGLNQKKYLPVMENLISDFDHNGTFNITLFRSCFDSE